MTTEGARPLPKPWPGPQRRGWGHTQLPRPAALRSSALPGLAQAWPRVSSIRVPALLPRCCVTSRNKAHLSAPTYLNPKVGSTALSLENNWEDATKASTPSRHPTQASSLTLRDHGKGWGRQQSHSWVLEREAEMMPGHICHQDTTTSSSPRTQPPRTRAAPQPCTQASSLLVGFIFCWFIFFFFLSSKQLNVFYTAVRSS